MENLITHKEFMNVDEAAAYVTLARQTMYDYVHRKQIPYLKIGKKLVFRSYELSQWLSYGGTRKAAEKVIKERSDVVNLYQMVTTPDNPAQAIHRILPCLTDEQQEVIELIACAEIPLSVRTIADRLGISQQAVHQRINGALKAITALMEIIKRPA